MVWPVSDSAFDPAWRFEFVAPGFESAPPTEIIGQVLGGDAVEAVEPLLETAVIGVDVVDVQVRRRGDGFPGDGTVWKAIPARRAKVAIALPPSPMR